MNLIADTIQSFPTYEMREEAFLRSISTPLPRSHAGPGVFWRDFSKILNSLEDRRASEQIAYVTANPRDCLAFSTPRQVLMAAGLQVRRSPGGRWGSLEEVAQYFKLENNLEQPIRTLSGGETVKLALAKVYIRGAAVSRLFMASPFCWLDKDSLGYLEKVLYAYRKRKIPVKLFTLNGEEDTRQITDDCGLGADWPSSIPFQMSINKLRLTLGSTLTAFNMPPPPEVRVDDFEAQLLSPCLWVGGNGQGKSLIARVISGAMRSRGSARLTSSNGKHATRLIFQDVILQTLLRSFNTIRSQADACQADTVSEIYRWIISTINRMDPSQRFCDSGPRKEALPTVLETKAILVAVRLARYPGALILDEPDWGLSRTAANAFVAAVVNASHRRDVPVILITHKPWWDAAARSRVKIKKYKMEMAGGRVASFKIRLEAISHA